MKRNSILETIRQTRPQYIDIYVDNSFDLSCRIQYLMKKQDLDQKKLAHLLEKKESEICKWMSGSHNFTLKTLAKIEEVLGEKLLEICKNDFDNQGEYTIPFQHTSFNCLKEIHRNDVQKFVSHQKHQIDFEQIIY